MGMDDHDNVTHISGSEFEISVPKEIRWNLDGEGVSNAKETYKLQVLPQHIEIIVPKRIKRLLF